MYNKAKVNNRGSVIRQLEEFGIERKPLQTYILDRYDEPHRYYHTWAHINNMIEHHLLDFSYQIYQKVEDGIKHNTEANLALFLSIIYHDAVYDPKRGDNEEMSVEVFHKDVEHNPKISNKVKNWVEDAIMSTKSHRPIHGDNGISELLCNLDLKILEADFKDLLVYETQIFKEYQFADWSLYKEKRIEALIDLRDELNSNDVDNHLDMLIEYVANHVPNIAIYAGSFNPFHVGHLNIVQQAERIFDKVIIAKGINPDKNNLDWPDSIPEMYQQIEYTGLLTEMFTELTPSVNYTLIRGLRNGADLQYEMNQLRFIQDLNPNIKTIHILCDREFEHISSSAIRSLSKIDGIQNSQYEKYLCK